MKTRFRIALELALVALWLLPGVAHAQVQDPRTEWKSITSTTSGDVILGPLSGRGSGTVQLRGTWTGTYPIEGSLDDNCQTTTNWATLPSTSSLTSNGITSINLAAVRCVRIPDSGWSSGTTIVRIQASSAGGGAAGAGGAGDASLSEQQTQTTSLQLLDDAVYVDDADFTDSTSKGLLGFGLYQSSPQTITDGDVGPILLDSNGRVQIVGNVTLTSSAVDTELPAAGALANDLPIPTAPLVGAVLMCATAGVDVDFCVSGDKAEDAAHASGDTGPAVLSRRIDTPATSAGASGEYATFNTDALGRLWTINGNPCADPARITHAVISETTGATNEIVALNGSDLIYVCSYKFVTTAANSLNWTRGTGTDCATGTTAIEGAQPYGANGGVAEDGGGAPLFVVPAGNALCLVSSTATAHGGRVSYVRTAAP